MLYTIVSIQLMSDSDFTEIENECGLDDHTFLALIYLLHLYGITAKKYKDNVNVH